MKAKIKLRPAGTRPTAARKPAFDADGYGRRWTNGESIRKLAVEAGLVWGELQRRLRVAGYLRSWTKDGKRKVITPN